MVQEQSGSTGQAASRSAKPGQTSSPQTPVDSITRLNEADLALVQSAARAVHNPDARALAKALGVDPAGGKAGGAYPAPDSLEELGDLDGDGIPEFALKQMRGVHPPGVNGAAEIDLPSWEVFLLAWDGSHWRASWIKNGFEPFELRVVSSLSAGSRQIALIVYASGAIPYPAIYQVKDHVASLVWDGRAKEIQYQGYKQGKIEFVEPKAGDVSRMIVSGRADPGVLHFPKDGKRGFDVQAVYRWDGKGYVPDHTEYAVNEDYQLYQFISALHLHNFRAAYALIDPDKFLMTDTANLDGFRRLIENSWPEFLDDQIFEARDSGTNGDHRFAFELSEADKHYAYYPSFDSDSKHLLIGLERCEERRSDK